MLEEKHNIEDHVARSRLEDSSNNTIVSELPVEAQQKLKIIQSLLEPCDRATYGDRLREGAKELGISVRSVQRLFKRYQEEGLNALTINDQRDKGKHRIKDFWESFILKTYKEGNKGSKRMNVKQVAIRVQAKALELNETNPPSYRTVLRVLNPIINQEKKTIRSPGWEGSTLSVKTRDGVDLNISYSNQVWQCDHTKVDVLLVDKNEVLLDRPWLTTVIDSYSRCIVGVNIGFDAPSSNVVGLALRHAILPKHYPEEYRLNCEWGTYGLPQYLFTDGGKDFRSNHLEEIATQLGFVLKLRDRPSEGGIVERPFKTLNQSLFSTLPGYTGSNVQERPEDAEKDAQLTLQELERLIVRFIVDKYNQSIDARMGDQTRFQRWEAGLRAIPEVMSERDLDICLMKQARRQVQRGGYLLFENIHYKGEYLEGFAGKTVSLRYDPRDITTIWVYQHSRGQEEFLTRAYAQGLETESLSLADAKASAKRLREKEKNISNEAILQEVIDREVTIKNKSRKQRQKEEQSYKKTPSLPVIEKEQESFEQVEEILLDTDDDFEVWDLDEMKDDYGW
ncbi:Tn552 transposase [Geminocystis sp. NIES-3708]|uniref:Mu transposase C-terminal domain-containing protein n=1 Tax=Geminocystis sp. NIES-3708 TaxID=1615909 RepID=UPI0005FC8F15|nr:Mu transposase C-terminal domain-containing protein [Geminocystis sp. NIES-3708]BAQ60391.1 Tn552 transposase [Geminocystis sp. NIES-3708]